MFNISSMCFFENKKERNFGGKKWRERKRPAHRVRAQRRRRSVQNSFLRRKSVGERKRTVISSAFILCFLEPMQLSRRGILLGREYFPLDSLASSILNVIPSLTRHSYALFAVKPYLSSIWLAVPSSLPPIGKITCGYTRR